MKMKFNFFVCLLRRKRNEIKLSSGNNNATVKRYRIALGDVV